MHLTTFEVDDVRRLVEAGIKGFDTNPRPHDKPIQQLALESAIRAAHGEGDLLLALALMMVACARVEGEIQEVARMLLERHINRHPEDWRG